MLYGMMMFGNESLISQAGRVIVQLKEFAQRRVWKQPEV